MLSNIAKKYPTKLAVKYIEVNYTRTYYEFNKEVDKYAKGLLGMGIGKGDHVAIWATNYPEWLILFFATARVSEPFWSPSTPTTKKLNWNTCCPTPIPKRCLSATA